MAWSKVISSLVGLVALFILVSITAVEATPLDQGSGPFIEEQGVGLSLAAAGVGLQDLNLPGGGTGTISIGIGGPVVQAILYWQGRDFPCPVVDGECVGPIEPFLDQVLQFGPTGSLTTLEGTITGSETQFPPSPVNNVGYRADVTTIVSTEVGAGGGLFSFDIEDGDTSSNFSIFNGAGLLVLYNDPAELDTFKVIVFDGLDFAFQENGQLPAALITEPVDFGYVAEGADRSANLIVFVGDANAGFGDAISITDISGVTLVQDQLDSSDGNKFDVDNLNITIPALSDTTTVQMISGPNSPLDSLAWQVGALRLPVAPPANPAIDIEKATNGEDADAPIGPVLPVGSTATFTYEVRNTGDVPLSNVSVVDDNGTPGAPGDDFSPDPDLIGGFNSGDTNMDNILDLAEVWQYTANRIVTPGQYTNGSQVCGDAPDGQVVCDDDPSNHFGDVPQTGGEGCTPGYWKQTQHFDSWVGFDPSDDYETVFSVDASFNKDLLGALKQGGGGEKALGRHAVAALLNTANGGVSYAFDTAGVIALVQQAYATGDFEGIKNQLATENELGCPLN